jgi:predicted ATPase
LLSTSELNNLQRQVGQILASEIIDAPILDGKGSILPCTNSSIIFTAVNLLNIQGGELTGDFSSHQLILLNHAAGTLAMAKASFQLASGYFEQAIDLVRDEDWTNQLCSKVYEGAVLAAYSDGNTQKMELHARALTLRDDVPLLNKVTTYHTMSQSLQSRERSEEALRLNMHLLAQLGVRFPMNKVSTKVATISGLLRSKHTLQRINEINIETLAVVTDAREIAIGRTLDVLITSAYQAKPELIPVAILKMFRQTFRIGLLPCSSIAYMWLGILMAAGLEDFESVEICHAVSWAAQKRAGVPENLPRLFMLSNHLKSWYLPLQDTMELAHQAHRYGLLHGDIENGAWAVMFAIENSVEMGKPLPVVICECITYASQLESYSMLKQKRGLCWWWQVSCNLCG